MRFLAALPLLFIGCASAPLLEPGLQVKHAKIERTEQEDYAYLLMLNTKVVDSHYWGLRFTAAEIALENSAFAVSDEELRRAAVEYTAGEVVEILRQKYGDCLAGEVLPLTKVILLTSDVPLDLTCVNGWLEH